ncbi:MAG: branched-chain amino acid ABC transporter permease [Candidatus Sumerlaeia bacterium]
MTLFGIDMDIFFSPLCIMGLFVMLSVSLNIINGFTGMLTLGHVAFYGAGAYVAMFYMNAFSPPLFSAGFWFHMIIGMILAAIAAGVVGFLVGMPCLRLAGDYLAIATLAFAEIFKIVLESTQSLGGPTGIPLSIEKIPSHWAFVLILVMIVLISLFALRLKRSATGRAFFAIRENEIAARVMGMNIAFLKVEAFVIGSAIAGMAGAIYAYSNYTIAPSDFDIMMTIMILLMIVLGGQGSVTGAIIGAIILALVDPAVRYASEITSFGPVVWVTNLFKENPQLIYAFLLIALIRLRPQGIFGMHEWSYYFGKRKRLRQEQQNQDLEEEGGASA